MMERKLKKKGSRYTVKMVLLSLVSVLILQGHTCASAADIIVYPFDTPVSTRDPGFEYSELTVNVVPKYIQILAETPETWTVTVEVEILVENKLNHIELYIWVKTTKGWTTTLSPSSITAPSSSIITGPTPQGNKWYLIDISRTSTYGVSDKITVVFDINSPALKSGHYELVQTKHRADGPGWNGQESTTNNKIQVHFDVGPELIVPEYPLGTISGISISLLSLVILYKRKSIIPNF